MNRAPAAALALLVPLTAITGCGGAEDQTQPPAVSTSATPEASASASPSPSTAALSACELTAPVTAGDAYVATYIPTWGEDSEFDAAAKLEGVDEAIVSFANVSENADVSIDFGSAAAQSAIKSLSSRAKLVTIAFGGYGSAETRPKILAGFDKGLDEPEVFAGKMVKVAKKTAAFTGVKKAGIEIDYEYPDDEQAAKLPALVTELKQQGIEDVSMAVSAGEDGAPTLKVAKELADMGVTFHVMTYDLNGSWNDPKKQGAGPITDVNWMIDAVGTWVDATGKPAQVAAGIPTYGYDFIGAKKAGDPFNKAAMDKKLWDEGPDGGPLSCTDIDPAKLIPDPLTLTSGAQTELGWTSYVTPNDAAEQVKQLRAKYPDVTTFTWEALSTTQGHIQAQKQQ